MSTVNWWCIPESLQLPELAHFYFNTFYSHNKRKAENNKENMAGAENIFIFHIRRYYYSVCLHLWHQLHRSEETIGRSRMFSPSMEPTEKVTQENNTLSLRYRITYQIKEIKKEGGALTRGKLSGSIQIMLRLGSSVLSWATSFRISRNSKPSMKG